MSDAEQNFPALTSKIFLIFWVAVFFNCTPSWHSNAEDSIFASRRNDMHVIITHIGGEEYHVPIQYLGYPLKSQETEALLDAVLPNLSPVDWEEKPVPASEVDRQLSILIHDSKSTTDVPFRFDVVRKRLAPLTSQGTKFGLGFYRSGSMNGFLDKQRASPRTEDFNELFFINENSPQLLYIDCLGDKARAYPGCHMVFSSNGLLYQIDFRKTHLSEWSSIKQASIKLIDGFRGQPVKSDQH